MTYIPEDRVLPQHRKEDTEIADRPALAPR
jgi:hypothetical protein